MKKIFTFNPASYAKEFAEKGFVFIPKGVTEEFHQYMVKQAENYQQSKVLKDFALGNKQQSLFEFPENNNALNQLFEMVSGVTGIDSKRLVLSERHIKSYEPDANPNPLAHKDRYASEISVGLSIHVPKGSKLILYPYDHIEVNPFNSAAGLRASFSPDQLPEEYLTTARKVEYTDSPRDVLVFRGSAVWHLRSNPANTMNLYLKFNSFNCDPIGEDPTTAVTRKRTLEALTMSDDVLLNLTPMVGRRVDYVHRQYTRQWDEVLGVVLWGESHFTIDMQEFAALKAMDGKRNVRAVISQMNGSLNQTECLNKIRRLAARGVVDLIPALD
ncbi:MAG: hypothetical protein HY707_07345 [Ignavibacteriae bacterium]|nr:hypothetical protein [Ignavibacteriota bacterium]